MLFMANAKSGGEGTSVGGMAASAAAPYLLCSGQLETLKEHPLSFNVVVCNSFREKVGKGSK